MKAKKELNKKACKNERKYRNTPAKEGGNSHERMKYVMQCLAMEIPKWVRQLEETPKREYPGDLIHAIYDLEIEIQTNDPTGPVLGKVIGRQRSAAAESGNASGSLTNKNRDF